jgi:hypothetical protein
VFDVGVLWRRGDVDPDLVTVGVGRGVIGATGCDVGCTIMLLYDLT